MLQIFIDSLNSQIEPMVPYVDASQFIQQQDEVDAS
jgi:hypothetical protein